MATMLFKLADPLAKRVKAKIPAGERSALVSRLLENELARRDHELYECALAVENDACFRAEMAEWNVTLADGLA